MKTNHISKLLEKFTAAKNFVSSLVMLVVALTVSMMLMGCQTQSDQAFVAANAQALTSTNSEAINLREGDVLKISFPGSPSLNTTQPIRRDGKISMSLVGEVDAAGMTPVALENKLKDLYASQLVTKEVTVEVVSSTFPVYVTGMVLRPGKVLSDHPLTALEAIMEAGGFDYTKANLKGVVVIRREGSNMEHYTLDLKAVLGGQSSELFYLKPSDIVYVPERFSMF